MYRRKMEKQTCSVKSVKTPMLPELSDDNKRSQPLPQVQAYNRLTPDKLMPMLDRSIPIPDKPTPTPGNKHLWHHLPHNSDAKMIHLVPTDCVHEISSGASSAMDSKSTTHHKPTWEPLLLLRITSKIPQRSDASKPTFASQLLRSKKEVLDTTDLQQVPTPEAYQSARVNDFVARVPLT
jgi:hypothetical protein